jgi:hypothetical protein
MPRRSYSSFLAAARAFILSAVLAIGLPLLRLLYLMVKIFVAVMTARVRGGRGNQWF